jgi:hypothetical protein
MSLGRKPVDLGYLEHLADLVSWGDETPAAVSGLVAQARHAAAELRECRTQRDENLANVRRIDDLRIAETARLQRELDEAKAEIEKLRPQVKTWRAYLRWRAEQDAAEQAAEDGEAGQ